MTNEARAIFYTAFLDYIVGSLRDYDYDGASYDDRRASSQSIRLDYVESDDTDDDPLVEIGCYISRTGKLIEGLGADLIHRDDDLDVYLLDGHFISVDSHLIPETIHDDAHWRVCISLSTAEEFSGEQPDIFEFITQ